MLEMISLIENLNDSFLFVRNKTIKYKDNNIIKIKAKIATSNFNIDNNFLFCIYFHEKIKMLDDICYE